MQAGQRRTEDNPIVANLCRPRNIQKQIHTSRRPFPAPRFIACRTRWSTLAIFGGIVVELIRHCGKCKALSWLGTLLLLSCGAFAAELGTNQQNHAAPPSEGLPRTVTLITGDQVVLTSEDGRFISVQPGKGRERMSFTTQYQFSAHDKSEHLYVIPHDAAPLIAAGNWTAGCST